MLLSGERLSFKQLMNYADTKPRHISVEFIPRRSAEGSVEGLYTLVQDISAQKILEAELRKSEQRFRLMADSSPALIWVSDEPARITFANKRYEEVFGRPVDEITGEGWRRIVHPDDLDAFFQRYLDAFTARERFRADVRVIDRSGAILWLHRLPRPKPRAM